VRIQLPRRQPSTAEPLDPIERYAPLIFRLGVYGLLSVFLVQAIEVFAVYKPGVPWPGLLWVLRTFTFLPLHEGGHFISLLFGRTLYVLGGSFWQVMFPLLWFALALKQKSQVAPFPLFWTGENMMDVSLYIRDAPVRAMPLLGGHKSGHDWHYLLTQWNAMDFAEPIADIMYYGGIILSVIAIAGGTVWAFLVFYRSGQPDLFTRAGALTPNPSTDEDLEDTLNEKLKQYGCRSPGIEVRRLLWRLQRKAR
jgi:hypothetical protein